MLGEYNRAHFKRTKEPIVLTRCGCLILNRKSSVLLPLHNSENAVVVVFFLEFPVPFSDEEKKERKKKERKKKGKTDAIFHAWFRFK